MTVGEDKNVGKKHLCISMSNSRLDVFRIHLRLKMTCQQQRYIN